MYYAGGYYAGGYYAGGFFGNLFGGAAKIIGGAVGGLIKGGPVGAIGGAVKGTVAAVSTNSTKAVLEAGGTETALTPELIAKHAAAVARGATAGVLPTVPMIGQGAAVNSMAMVGPGAMVMGMGVRGLRPNKSTYVTRGGGTSRWPVGIAIHVKGTELVKGRRMNVANPRALRRALRRGQGFAKLARRFVVMTTRFKKGKRVGRRR